MVKWDSLNPYIEPKARNIGVHSDIVELIDKFIRDNSKDRLYIKDYTRNPEVIIPLISNYARSILWPNTSASNISKKDKYKPILVFPKRRGYLSGYVNNIGEVGISENSKIGRQSKSVNSTKDIIESELSDARNNEYEKMKNIYTTGYDFSMSNNYKTSVLKNLYNSNNENLILLNIVDLSKWSKHSEYDSLDPICGTIFYDGYNYVNSNNTKNIVEIDKSFLKLSEVNNISNYNKPVYKNLEVQSYIINNNPTWKYTIPVTDIKLKKQIKRFNKLIKQLIEFDDMSNIANIIKNNVYKIVETPGLIIKRDDEAGKKSHLDFTDYMPKNELISMIHKYIGMMEDEISNILGQVRTIIQDIYRKIKNDNNLNKTIKKISMNAVENKKHIRFVASNKINKKSIDALIPEYISTEYVNTTTKNIKPNHNKHTFFTFPIGSYYKHFVDYPPSLNNSIVCYDFSLERVDKNVLSESDRRNIYENPEDENINVTIDPNVKSDDNNSSNKTNSSTSYVKIEFQNGGGIRVRETKKFANAEDVSSIIKAINLNKNDKIKVKENNDKKSNSFYQDLIQDSELKGKYQMHLKMVNKLWDENIISLNENYETYQDFLEDLIRHGATIETSSAISGWFRETLGPKDLETVKAVCKLSDNLTEENSKDIYESLEYIRRTNRLIGRKYNKYEREKIINNTIFNDDDEEIEINIKGNKEKYKTKIVNEVNVID